MNPWYVKKKKKKLFTKYEKNCVQYPLFTNIITHAVLFAAKEIPVEKFNVKSYTINFFTSLC